MTETKEQKKKRPIYSKTQYMKKKNAGLCTVCGGKRDDDTKFVVCKKCRINSQKYAKKYYDTMEKGKKKTIFGYRKAKYLRVKDRDGKYLVGFTCGSFDLFHAGHALMFQEAKSQCKHLIVGLQSDPTLDRTSKNKPIMSVIERAILLKSCRYIDAIVLYETEQDLLKMLKWLPINVRFLGADWKNKKFTGQNLPIKVIFNSRNHEYSSSELREKIKSEN